MKKLMVAVAAVAMAMGAMAEGEANRFRVNVGGFGRMGIESRIATKHYFDFAHNFKKHQGEIYGGTIDLLANVMPGETFNLWTGLSLSFAPNQHLSTFSMRDFRMKARYELETYDIRWMLIPEVNVCDSLALGLRLGVGLQGYKVDLSLESGNTNSDYLKMKDINEFMPYALVGAQATWMFSENLGAFVACDFRFSEEASSGDAVRLSDGDGNEDFIFKSLNQFKIAGTNIDVTAGVSMSF